MAQRRIPIRDIFLLKTNHVIRFLTLVDFVAYSAAGLLAPIFSLFIVEFIDGGNAAVAGTAAAIFLLTKSIMQLPAGAIVDKICGDKDDFWFLVGGMFVASLVPLSYLFISTPLELYITQFVLGLAIAFTFPSFMALFTRYIEKGREASVWGVYYTVIDIASAGAAAIGGVLAYTIGFEKVIYAVTILGLLSLILYIPVLTSLKKSPETC